MHDQRKKHVSLHYPGWEKDQRLPGAGRPPEADSGVSRLKRAPISSRYPVLVTLQFKADLPNLRTPEYDQLMRRAFAATRDRVERGEPGAFRIVHYVIGSPRTLHLIVEARDRPALTRGIKGTSIRIARALNAGLDRTGSALADRYDDRVLHTQEEVNQVLGVYLRLGTGRPRKFSSEVGPEEEWPTSAPHTRLLIDAVPDSPA